MHSSKRHQDSMHIWMQARPYKSATCNIWFNLPNQLPAHLQSLIFVKNFQSHCNDKRFVVCANCQPAWTLNCRNEKRNIKETFSSTVDDVTRSVHSGSVELDHIGFSIFQRKTWYDMYVRWYISTYLCCLMYYLPHVVLSCCVLETIPARCQLLSMLLVIQLA